MQFGNLATWQFGNLEIWGLEIWQLENLAAWQFGNLARNAELTFNFVNFQNWQLSTLATFNFGNFQFWQLSILATFKFGNFQFWQLSILARVVYICASLLHLVVDVDHTGCLVRSNFLDFGDLHVLLRLSARTLSRGHTLSMIGYLNEAKLIITYLLQMLLLETKNLVSELYSLPITK